MLGLLIVIFMQFFEELLYDTVLKCLKLFAEK